MAPRSSARRILLVAWRSRHSRASSGVHADAVVLDADRAACRRTRRSTVIRRAPASIAFSTSSLTTEAGRSTTSPAAIWLARSSGSLRMRATAQPARAAEPRHHRHRGRQHERQHPPELRLLAARQVRQRHVHAVETGEHRERPEDRRDHRQQLRVLVQPVRDAGQVRVEDAGHAILEDDRVVGEPHQLIVDVAEAVGHLLVDHRELATGQPADRRRAAACTTRRSLEMSRLTARISPVSASPAVLEHLALDVVEPRLELVDLGPVVVDHRVDDAVHQRDRPLARAAVLRSHRPVTCAMLRRLPSWTVTRKRVARKKSVSWVSKACSLGLEVDAVQDDVEDVVVGLDLRDAAPARARRRRRARGCRRPRGGPLRRRPSARRRRPRPSPARLRSHAGSIAVTSAVRPSRCTK